MWRHYVYIHRKADSGEPFYVGKGSLRRSMAVYERAESRSSRSKWWHRVVAKHGITIEVVAMCADDAEAQRQERCLIAEVGRAALVNLTDGGDGHAGIVPSAEMRRKRSENAKRPRTEAWVASIRRAREGGGNGGVVKIGGRLPASWRANIAAGKRGAKNPWHGKPSPPSKAVVNTSTGTTYPSVARAAAAEGINPKTLYQYLDGTRPNCTNLARA